jgi:hypothetical protein
MDQIFILTTDVCCYQYDPELRACTQFINDRRLRWNCWTRSERRHYYAKEDLFNARVFSGEIDRPLNYPWYEEVFDQIRAQELDKTLIEMPYNGVTTDILERRIKRGYFKERGDRILAVSFFHSDEDTEGLLYGNCNPEDLVESKISWIYAIIQNKPFIKTVEIPYDFTLTKEYMLGLFEQYVLSGSGV